MQSILGRQPVYVLNLILAVVALLAVLWPERLDPATQAGIIGVGIAIVSFLANGQVTPVASPVLPNGTAVTTPSGGSSTVKAA